MNFSRLRPYVAAMRRASLQLKAQKAALGS
jgi:hypothetical protein